ncbi:oligopeptide ABC transporter permease [Paenibacillus apiarius]|uniref:ABC transporter permease n=1 Tax=Paenibacillus apiarius TaxID=46240 RepID=A0ABT4E148_9BACL|nr:oligopeptide ABC transporter permease [Paenibacillus apiarius]MBN3525746.1 ABC transporter permease [Paenibacillus apiarius]MCY9512893.1 ABC transporter permease [Paenibacillus apiarius]MCY9522058.1 ABC transporter permease [Paenibacillus apiarius]MCY9554123.1 ABC transporter permease [Paenibacillus apiarius]MCY9558818.1 ABC transporter permease [Paenibacillus apiarius]
MSQTVAESTAQDIKVQKLKPASPWRLAFKQLLKNKFAVGGLVVIVLMFLICFLGPLFSPYSLETMNIRNGNKAPSAAHWLGTDNLGRDILLRVMLAGRVSLLVGLVAMMISVAIGSTLGALAGYYRGWVDSVIMRLADIMMSIPSLPLLIILGAVLSDMKVPPDKRIYVVMFLLGFMSWPSLARLVRGQILMLREQEFMQAAEVLGLRDRRKIFRHLLPNTIPIIIVVATLMVAGAILQESVLSYLGLGVVPPTPSWGNMITAANNLIDFQKRPWLWVPPGVCIFFTVIAINVIGDGLRDVLDPKMKR